MLEQEDISQRTAAHGEPMLEQKGVWERGEGVAERSCYGLITTLHSPSPCPTWGGEQVGG